MEANAPRIELRDFHGNMVTGRVPALRARWERLARFVKQTIRGRKAERDLPLVSNKYQDIYGVGNAEWLARRDARRDRFSFRGQCLQTNGWFMTSMYNQALYAWVERLGAKSILEVGSGRGQNLLMLALRDSSLRLQGLEYSPNGVANSRLLFENPPPEIARTIGLPADAPLPSQASRIQVVQGSAFELPFADKSFDLSYTVLVLEQMPHEYEKALREMRRVTRGHCIFIEPFREANDAMGRRHLATVDYFRYSYETFRKFGLEPLHFSDDLPQKLRFGAGLLVTKVAG